MASLSESNETKEICSAQWLLLWTTASYAPETPNREDKAALEKSKEEFLTLQASVKQASVMFERPQETETLASQEPSGHSYSIITLFACLCSATVGLALMPSLTQRFRSQSASGLYMPLQEELLISTEEATSFFDRLRQQFSTARNEAAPPAWSVHGTDGDLA